MANLYEPLHRTSIQTRWIKCRKPACTKCPHGPYLYRVWREGPKIRTEYLGKAPPMATVASPGGGRLIAERAPHPYAPGADVRFTAGHQPYWILVTGNRQQVFDTRPPMRVEAIGWGQFGRSTGLTPYVTLVTQSGQAVHHPYDASFSSADLAGRLDRRFPVILIERH